MREMNLTEGPVFGRLIWFSLPMIAGNLLQQVYNLVDTLVVGRFIGPDALAAVGSSYTLMTFITSVIIGLCMGSGAFFSADYGAGNRKRLKEDVWHSFWFIFLVTAAIYAVVYPGTEWILAVLQTPDRIFDMTREYVTVIFAGLIFVFLYNFFAFLLRGMGNSVVPLIFLGISSVINIVLDLWFVAGLSMGVSGAAWATVIAQAVSGLGIGIYSFVKVSELRFSPEDMKFSAARLKETAVNDFATGIQQSVMNFGILMIQGLVNSFGTTVMAAFAAAVKIDTVAYMPSQEFGNAYSLFVSQNYGAGKPDRIREGTRIALITSAVFSVAVSAVIFLSADSLMSIFVDGSEHEIISEGVRYLRIEGSMYIGIGVLFLWYGYYRGTGRPHISLILTVISLGTRVVLSYALAPGTSLGVTAIWASIPVGWVLADIAGAWIYRRKR
ncbi:MAG TPA: MATE family efflux transporter [Candidatus Avanaerovorax faecigallinarum]|nr:MATE family efflux transporter [Candidatus Avanaerovorax faecigallinarum]